MVQGVELNQPKTSDASDPLRQNRYDRIYYVGILVLVVVAFVQMLDLAAHNSLWLDDMFQIDYCLSESITDVITIDPYTPPLFNVLAWIWYRIAPFGEVWLRLLGICFVVASLVLVAATGRKLSSRRSGFIAAFMLAINAKVITNMAMNFRAYALLLFLSSLFVFLQVRRLMTPTQNITYGQSAGLAVTMLALGYTHYFGVLLAVPFFFVDLYLLARGRLNGARLKVFAPYAIAVLLYLPWLNIAMQTLGSAQTTVASGDGVDYWQGGGEGVNTHGLLYWLCGECAEVVGLFHIAAIIICVTAAYRAYKREFTWHRELPLVALVFAILALIYAISLYARYVNPNTVIMVERYFTPLIPCIVIVSSWGVAKIFSWIPTNDPVRFIAAFLSVLLLVPSTMATVSYDMSEKTGTRFYGALTAYLESCTDIANDSTILLATIDSTDRGRQIRAWQRYYFDQKGTRDFAISIMDGLDPSVMLNPYDLLKYDTVYMTCQHMTYEIPDLYRGVLSTYFNAYSVLEDGALELADVHVGAGYPPDGPGGGKTFKFVRVDTSE